MSVYLLMCFSCFGSERRHRVDADLMGLLDVLLFDFTFVCLYAAYAAERSIVLSLSATHAVRTPTLAHSQLILLAGSARCPEDVPLITTLDTASTCGDLYS